MKAKVLIGLLEREGWYFVRQAGSHKIFKHPEIPDNISVPDHGKVDLDPGLLHRSLKIAKIKT